MSFVLNHRLWACLTVLTIAWPWSGFAQDDDVEALRKQVQALTETIQAERKRNEARIGGLLKRIEMLESQGSATGNLRSLAPLTNRVDALEMEVLDIDERVGDQGVVHVFDGLSLDLGGFITQSFAVVGGEDSSEASFNQTLFELLIRAQVTDDWSFFTALGFLREADVDLSDAERPFFRDSQNRVPQIIGWANYRHSDALQLQLGRFVTPQGIINIEHFPPTLLEINQPQFLRPFPGATMFPNFLSGVNLHGKRFYDDSTLDYALFAGALVSGDPDDFVAGGRLAYEFGDSGLKLGVNYTHGRREAAASPLGHLTITPTKSLTTNSYDLVGADLLYEKGRVLWKNEFFYSFESTVDDRVAAYTQPGFRINDQWITFYRYDYLDPGQGLDASSEHVFGVNFLPAPTLRLRAVYIYKEFDATNDSNDFFQLSATISF